MKYVLGAIFGPLVIVVLVALVNLGLAMVSEASNLTVALGVLLLSTIATVVIGTIAKVVKHYVQKEN